MAKYIVVHGIRIAKDFVPETFGRLTTIGPKFRLDVDGKYKRPFSVCVCSCGEVCVVEHGALVTQNTRSCGCLRAEVSAAGKTTHGLSHSDEYGIYQGMIRRCHGDRKDTYKYYGAMGVQVFEDWRYDTPSGFASWLAYMGPRPSKEHTIDRFPNPKGNYEPGNVRWATMLEQNNNRSSNNPITFEGKTQTRAEWEREKGLKPSAIYNRLNMGWNLEKAMNTSMKWQKK